MKPRAGKSTSTGTRPVSEGNRENSAAGRWLVGGAVVSTLVLLVAYVAFEPTADELPAAEAADRQPVAPPVPEPSRTAGHESSIALPTEPREIQTEAEQQQLLADVERALEKFPDDATVFYIAGLTYAELLQTDKAITMFGRSLEIDSSRPEVLAQYSDVLLQVGQQQEAVSVLQQAVDGGVETVAILTALGDAYSQLGEVEQAAEILGRAVERFPDQPAAWLRLAQAQVQLGRFEKAEKNARTVIALGQDDRAAYLVLSTALIRLGRREEALKIRGQMPKIEPQVVPDDEKYQRSFRGFASNTYSMLASAYSAHNSLSQAEQWLLRSIELEPASAKSLISLADLYRKEGRFKDSIQVHKRLIEIQPTNLLNYTNLASLAVSVGDVPLAESSLRQAVKADQTGNADLQLARFLIGVGNLDDAAAHAQIAVERLETVDAYLVWISTLRAQGNMALAFDALLKAREIAPDDPRLMNLQL